MSMTVAQLQELHDRQARIPLMAPAKGGKVTQRYRLVMFKNVVKAWHWRVLARNGRICATSEAYSSRTRCRQTAKHFARELGCSQTVEERE